MSGASLVRQAAIEIAGSTRHAFAHCSDLTVGVPGGNGSPLGQAIREAVSDRLPHHGLHDVHQGLVELLLGPGLLERFHRHLDHRQHRLDLLE